MCQNLILKILFHFNIKDDLELGELTLTLCYLPAAGRLTVTVVKAINLKSMDLNGKSGKFIIIRRKTFKKRL